MDGDYRDVGVWIWNASGSEEPQGREIFPTGNDEFGPWFQIDENQFETGALENRIGFIPRLKKNWRFKDGGDRFWTRSLGDEVWIVSGDQEIHLSRPDIAPRVEAAYHDAEKLITIVLSHPISLGRLVPSTFQIKCATGPLVKVAGVRATDAHDGIARRIELDLGENIPAGGEVMVLIDGYRPGTLMPRHLQLDIDSLYTKRELGAYCFSDHTIFRLFSPAAHRAWVYLYPTRTGSDDQREELAMNLVGHGLWEAYAWGDHAGLFYSCAVECNGDGERTEAVDFYACCTTGHDGRGLIVNPRSLDPSGFRPVHRPPFSGKPTDAVIYEVHVRDFTIDPMSGIERKDRGKFLGMARRDTQVKGHHRVSGLDHLLQLGVTHVQLLPVQDFDNDESDNVYNWGYMTSNFFSPDGWYASDYRNESKIREFKKLVKTLHDAGLRVVMDVVYNHTGVNATFEQLNPGYYHRMREDGTFWNGSGTGNEFRSEAPMGQKFIVDSCLYWVNEFGVDGFRFDLMGLIDLETMIAVRDAVQAVDPTILVYGEPWAATGPDGAGIGRIVYKDVIAGTGIGAFNDHFRNALKGAPDGPEPGYIHDASNPGSVKAGIQGSIHDWSSQPGEAIQYADCHDNLTLYDKSAEACPEATETELIEMQRLAIGILAISQGVCFFHGGVEFARTKGGNHNSYNAPDSVNAFHWQRCAEHEILVDYTTAMIALRRSHPVFRLTTREEIDARLVFEDTLSPDPSAIYLSLNGENLKNETWKKTLVLINPHPTDMTFPLPPGRWKIHIQGWRVSTKGILDVQENVPVPARGLVIARLINA